MDKVIFKKFKDGAVIAIFPEIQASVNVYCDCLSYMHVGQHGPCSVSIMQSLKPATPAEYEGLKTELQELGYNLKIVRRISQKMHRARTK